LLGPPPSLLLAPLPPFAELPPNKSSTFDEQPTETNKASKVEERFRLSMSVKLLEIRA